ncbi:two-component system sensor histidine kinase RppB [Gloeocapsopsis dulcis]|nr:two-component system sensor histidine kinase RppB [Gloeocapsopsis dulcis]WNN87875.1 ATP-binding protein [Gloeocapsopsis dulcis]
MVSDTVSIRPMYQNKLFQRTRWQLAGWYTLVMGFILSVCGLGLYEAVDHAHQQTLDRELESVAGTLHDSIETTLQQPGKLNATAQQLLPPRTQHVLGVIHQGDYYIRLLNNSEQVIAVAGFHPEGLPLTSGRVTWQTLEDLQGNRYHQISLPLHTRNNLDWGYMQVGRSLKDIDDYLANVRLILLLGLPIAMVLVGGASWWLAGLAMQPIYQSYSQIQQFTADVAHELRTPLAALGATVESALGMPTLSEAEARDTLRTVERQNRRLTTLVTDLLLLARLERQHVLVHRKCCLNDIINDLVEELAAWAIASEVQLIAEIKVHQQLQIVGDEEQLYRLVSNLIDNAIQYTPAGGVITVRLDRSDRHAVIQVQDTGIGIAPQAQQRIFDRFYRVSSDRSRHTGGSGLGLAIARAIVQAHGGSLQVQSELGKGSTFAIYLPLNISSNINTVKR